MYDRVVQPHTQPAFMWSEAQLIPQNDRMGKRQTWQRLDALRQQHTAQHTRAAQPAALDVTDGTLFPWKLWLCSLGYLTQDTLGVGIRSVHLQLYQDPIIILNLTRADDTVAELSLTQRTHADGGHSYHIELTE